MDSKKKLPNERWFSLPASFELTLEELMSEMNTSLKSARTVAEHVLRLSDHYVTHPQAPTPWDEKWARIAYLGYFFPLNYARASSVAHEAARLGFFEGLEHLFDFGSGSGSALYAFAELFAAPMSVTAMDVDDTALEYALRLRPPSLPVPQTKSLAPRSFADQTLLVASYALTELQALPEAWLECEALALIEPSTQSDGRLLMQHRQSLIDAGFHIWAPCTHMNACPLLVGSERDWCHDRIHWQAPAWSMEIEKHLPMKNRTLTFSYLLARKSKPGPAGGLARLTGDMQIEKGKTRQSLCRGPEREFLSWFPQRLDKATDAAFSFQRGNLVALGADLQKKASEVRITKISDIKEILPNDSALD